jgi:hypothetical protein
MTGSSTHPRSEVPNERLWQVFIESKQKLCHGHRTETCMEDTRIDRPVAEQTGGSSAGSMQTICNRSTSGPEPGRGLVCDYWFLLDSMRCTGTFLNLDPLVLGSKSLNQQKGFVRANRTLCEINRIPQQDPVPDSLFVFSIHSDPVNTPQENIHYGSNHSGLCL